MHIFFSVGEPSGDQHAAHLMQELQRRQTGLKFSGFGGVRMEEAGLASLYRLTNLAVMGVFAVIPLIWQFYSLVKKAERFFAEQRPDAVILVDFPGFNWWIASKAKALGIPVIYYLPPQLWAWAPWRVKRVQRYVDHVISALPFERDWYAEHGVRVDYVGHPFFDEIAECQLDQNFVKSWTEQSARIVAVLPGSRNQEVLRNWPLQVEMMRRLHARHPDVRFLIANYKETHRRQCVAHLLAKAPQLPVSFFVGRTPEIIEVADCAIMVSGSVSLELVARQTPAVVLYRVDWPTYFIGKALVTCKFMSLPNLIVKRRVMPEFLSVGNPEPVIAEATDVLDLWLRIPAERMKARDEVIAAVGDFPATGATVRTAELILSKLSLTNAESTARAA